MRPAARRPAARRTRTRTHTHNTHTHNTRTVARRYEVLRREDIPPVACPCGQARRAFGKTGCPASVHWVEIRRDAVAHWHARQTEIYVVLKGRGWLEIDGDRVPLGPGTAVWIQPGARHRARGRLTILNVVVPSFDPRDEHLVAD